ncbi:YoaK family protein [uncultured Chitinophaga sp.]|uniref:YoaK family protein n=1 Tax=uncultured Chitinophaga sp. TaxID=339340 RepID=UPI0025E97E02|nr:YoaK family protein [uncultured Chitinophaga sp.]
MEQNNTIKYITLLLTFCAGFCDTATFVAADELFSAHVTGNFIVFAYDIVNYSDKQAWLKLLSFPVFIVSVAVGGRIISKAGNKYTILVIEGLLMLLCGGAILGMEYSGSLPKPVLFTIAMVLVFAMGLQNAFSRLFAKETYGPTTIMTGNVTQLALDLEQGLRNKFDDGIGAAVKRQSITLSGFLAGCLAGGVLAQRMGLGAVALPGVLLVLMCVACFPLGKKN